MNHSGWKVDTGHKSGYLLHIEKELAKKLPSSSIKADPHIKSKLKVLKKKLSWILDIQKNSSGFGWDDDKKMVVGDKDTFMGWAKSRDGSSCLWGKAMVHYDKLVEIYASDLAKGNKVIGPGDQSDLNVDEDPDDTLNEEGNGSQAIDKDQAASHNQGTNTTPSTSRQSNKRKSSEIDALETEFIQISKSISSLLEAEKDNAIAMNDIKRAFVQEVDFHEKTIDNRKQLFQVLRTLPNLTQEQVVKATRLIGQDAGKMDMFLTMPDDFKVIFVLQEIDGDN